jgi:hypothetical protein
MVEREIVDVLKVQPNSQHPQLKSFASLLENLKKWPWQMGLSERIRQAQDLLLDVSTILDRINKLSETYLNECQNDFAVNNATIFKKTRIVSTSILK